MNGTGSASRDKLAPGHRRQSRGHLYKALIEIRHMSWRLQLRPKFQAAHLPSKSRLTKEMHPLCHAKARVSASLQYHALSSSKTPVLRGARL